MFLRATTRKKDGKEHRYWSVVENRRVAGGRVAHRHVLYLGEINSSQELAWRKSIEVLEDARSWRRSKISTAKPAHLVHGPRRADRRGPRRDAPQRATGAVPGRHTEGGGSIGSSSPRDPALAPCPCGREGQSFSLRMANCTCLPRAAIGSRRNARCAAANSNGCGRDSRNCKRWSCHAMRVNEARQRAVRALLRGTGRNSHRREF
jgi:hypothetical protein